MGASVLVTNGAVERAMIEAIAFKEAVCLAKDLGMSSMTIASDCAGVVQSILERYLGENAMNIREIRNLKLPFKKSCVSI
jgi:hypothetical protein